MEPTIAAAHTVLISPEGAIAKLPWGALPGSAKDAYLIEERAIAVVPVPRLLPERITSNSKMATSLLIVGDVNFDGDPGGEAAQRVMSPSPPTALVSGGRAGDLSHSRELPGSSAEMGAVADLFGRQFPKARLERLRQNDATKCHVVSQMSEHQYLHFATHGFFARQQSAPHWPSRQRAMPHKSLDRSCVRIFRAIIPGCYLAWS